MTSKPTVRIGGKRGEERPVPESVRGKWKWIIGSDEVIAGSFGGFFIEAESGYWYTRMSQGPSGVFYDTEVQARKAGDAKLKEMKARRK